MVYDFSDYEWSQYERPISANEVGAFCKEIEQKEGVVTKQNFLDASRPEDALTHCLFEWDDSIAGEKYRLMQSGKHLSDLKVKIVMDESKKQDQVVIRAFMNVKPDNTTGEFRNAIDAITIPQYRDGVLERAKKEMISFSEKYRTLSELSSVIDAIDECVKRLETS